MTIGSGCSSAVSSAYAKVPAGHDSALFLFASPAPSTVPGTHSRCSITYSGRCPGGLLLAVLLTCPCAMQKQTGPPGCVWRTPAQLFCTSVSPRWTSRWLWMTFYTCLVKLHPSSARSKNGLRSPEGVCIRRARNTEGP